ncbi:alanine--tRNA ligase [Candidatus Wolfebacteria bacterium]|nr:MAG: alanine--tRNA ligase [Candidatus Wolfebacteria bacterium]
MKTAEIRKRFLDFFEKRGHSILPSASLIPENDPSVLFNTAGMQPLVPYLLGQSHPAGKRLASSQKCVRTGDIDEIGDKTHATFFEMLGNWSLGDYFKEEAITWSYEFLTSKEDGLGLDPNRLYVTVFEGNNDAPRDEEAASYWEAVGVPSHRIYFRGVEDNWWSAGDTGPCGPDSEMFYDITPEGLGDLSSEEFEAADEQQKVVEIWNDVFMSYEKKDGKVVGELSQKNIDTGAGLERLAAILQNKDNIFDIDIFDGLREDVLVKSTSDIGEEEKTRAVRILLDHTRTAIFLMSDGVVPSNTDQGYVLRRLIRRAIRYADVLGIEAGGAADFGELIIKEYEDIYPELRHKQNIMDIFLAEINKFRITLEKGIRRFQAYGANNSISGTEAFDLYQTYGFPVELTLELASEKGITIDMDAYNKEMERHQSLSRSGAEQKFKGGLAGTGEMETKYHSATHLLHQALRDVLGDHVQQKGSNITSERLRFDFIHPDKMTDEEKKKVEDIVNAKIAEGLPMQSVTLSREEAEKTGALHFFADKYGDEVNVYYIGNDMESAYSKEFCGGPHVTNIGDLGTFKIKKEESTAAGIRRVKAVLV